MHSRHSGFHLMEFLDDILVCHTEVTAHNGAESTCYVVLKSVLEYYPLGDFGSA
jgi:hypothetical protein